MSSVKQKIPQQCNDGFAEGFLLKKLRLLWKYDFRTRYPRPLSRAVVMVSWGKGFASLVYLFKHPFDAHF